MSDATVTEAAPAPQSTAEIATEVVETAERSEPSESTESGETSAETYAEPAAEPAKPETPPAVVLSPAAQFLMDAGHKAQKEDGRAVWLPYKTVEKMLETYLGKHRTTWDGEKGTLAQERDRYKADLDELYSGVRSQDTKDFLKLVAKHDPRYQVYLDPPKVEAPKPPELVADMPQPDLALADGSRTYSIDGLKQLLEWNTSQVEARLLPKVDERLKPLTEREQQAKQREQQEQATTAVRERARAQMAELQKMPRFGALPADGSLTEFQQEVLTILKKDSDEAGQAGRRPTMTLKEAYYEAERPYLITDATKAREQALKDVDAAAKSGSPTVTRSSGVPPVKVATDTRSIVAREIARLEKSGA